MRLEDVPTLEGYCTTVEAGRKLGMDKANLYEMIIADEVTGVVSVTAKPIYLIPAAEVDRIARERAKRKATVEIIRAEQRSRRERSKRIKDWARAQGYAVAVGGYPRRSIVEAFDKAHPNE